MSSPTGNGSSDDRATVVARALADSPAGLSRREIADVSHMSLPTVDRALRELRHLELIEDHEDAAGAGIRLARSAGLVLGVDVGRAHRRASLADPHGNLIGNEPAEPNSHDEPEQFTSTVLIRIATLIEEAVAKANESEVNGHVPYSLHEIGAITIGLPYPVGPDGTVVGMFAPDLTGLPLGASLKGLLAERARRSGGSIHPRLQVWFARDADLGARALWREHLQKYPAGSPEASRARRDSLLYLKASHGLDAGMICHGVPVTGARGLAGQVGHMWLPQQESQNGRLLYEFDPDREAPERGCPRCGRRLCVENVASGQALVGLLQRQGSEPDSPETVADLVALLNNQQAEREAARAALRRAAAIIGVSLADVARLADPSRILIGGLLAATGDTFITPLRIAFAGAGLSGLDPKIRGVEPDEIRRVELRGAIAVALRCLRYPWEPIDKHPASVSIA